MFVWLNKMFCRNKISVEKVYLRKYRAVRYEMRPIAIAYLTARRARGTIFFYRYIIPDGISSNDISSLSFRQSSIPLVRKQAEAVQGCNGITNAYTHTIGITNADERTGM